MLALLPGVNKALVLHTSWAFTEVIVKIFVWQMFYFWCSGSLQAAAQPEVSFRVGLPESGRANRFTPSSKVKRLFLHRARFLQQTVPQNRWKLVTVAIISPQSWFWTNGLIWKNRKWDQNIKSNILHQFPRILGWTMKSCNPWQKRH